MYREYDKSYSGPGAMTAVNGTARPGVINEIEACHKEASILGETLCALADRLECVCEPLSPTVERPMGSPSAPPVEVAHALMELGRLRDRISSLNLAAQTLLARVSL